MYYIHTVSVQPDPKPSNSCPCASDAQPLVYHSWWSLGDDRTLQGWKLLTVSLSGTGKNFHACSVTSWRWKLPMCRKSRTFAKFPPLLNSLKVSSHGNLYYYTVYNCNQILLAMVYKLLHGPWIMTENFTIVVATGVQDIHCIPLPPDLLRNPYPLPQICLGFSTPHTPNLNSIWPPPPHLRRVFPFPSLTGFLMEQPPITYVNVYLSSFPSLPQFQYTPQLLYLPQLYSSRTSHSSCTSCGSHICRRSESSHSFYTSMQLLNAEELSDMQQMGEQV